MNNIELIRKCLSYDTSEWTDPNTKWYSNGLRGHLHTNGNCWKTANAKNFMTRTMSFVDALASHTLCSSCTQQGNSRFTSEQAQIFGVATILAEVAQNVQTINVLNAFPQPLHGYPVLNMLRKHFAYSNLLGKIDDAQRDTYVLLPWCTELRDKLTTALEQNRSDLDPSTEAIKFASLSILERELSNSSGTFFGGQIAKAVCGDEYSSPLAQLCNLWLKTMHENADVDFDAVRSKVFDENTISGIIGNGNDKHLTYKNMGFVSNIAHVVGETQWQYSFRAWQTKVHEIADTVVTLWEKRYNDLVSDTTPVVIAQSGVKDPRNNDSNMLAPNSILCAQSWVLHGSALKSVMICPRVIATFVQNGSTYSSTYSKANWSQVTVPGIIPNRECLEIALTLWKPGDERSMYNKFEAAYRSAEALQ
jgi:hypothetical protein